jgi:hypothetical protein
MNVITLLLLFLLLLTYALSVIEEQLLYLVRASDNFSFYTLFLFLGMLFKDAAIRQDYTASGYHFLFMYLLFLRINQLLY